MNENLRFGNAIIEYNQYSKNNNYKLIIENAEILPRGFRNFSGKEGTFNREGDRFFNIRLDDEELIKFLLDYGWNVRELASREEGEEPGHILQIKVSFKNYPPVIHRHVGTIDTLLDVDTVGQLDSDRILGADIVINPSHWEVNGKSGTAGYLASAHITVENRDYFSDKYGEQVGNLVTPEETSELDEDIPL